MKKSWPKISYCIITYNEEKNIEECLKSIFSQDYPKEKLEVILVDDNSTDRTVQIAKKFPVRIFYNGKKDADLSMTIGFSNATGDFYHAMGADMRLRGRKWFKKMVKPLVENPDISLSLTKYYSHKNESLITKYLSKDPLQRDLVYQFFTPGIEETISEQKEGYYLCDYSINKIPPQIHGLYRIITMKEIMKELKIWYDMGNLVSLVKKGYSKVAYVPEAGLYHFHAENLKELLRKRRRNADRSYLRYLGKRNTKKNHYQYFNLKNPKDISKLIVLIISANLFIPIFIFSLYRVIKNRDLIFLLDAPVTLLLVDTILFSFIKDQRGISMIRQSLSYNFSKL